METKGEIAAQTDSSSSTKILTADGTPVGGSAPLPVELTDGTTKVKVSDDGQLHVVMEGKSDLNNSTETPLGIDGVFTGTATNTKAYAAITILVESDQVSADGGLVVQFSTDGSPPWHDGESYTIPASTAKFFTPPVQAEYFRVIYTNGGVEQDSFHLHTMLKKQAIKWSSHNLQDTLADEDDAELVVAVLKLRTASNTYVSGAATNSGNFKVSLEELESDISDNSNSQLKITPYESSGGEYKQDLITGAFTTIDYSHHEIHSGSHFYNKDWADLASGATYDILVSVADTTKWPHFLFILGAEAEFNVILYAGVTTSNDGTPLLVVNRNGNSGTTNGMLAYHTPTITGLGTQIARYKGGSGKQVGGEVRANNEQILTQGVKFLARIHNDTTSNNWIDWLLDWYEHTNR